MFGHGEEVLLFRGTLTRSSVGQTRVEFAEPETITGAGFAPQTTQEPRDGTQVRVVTEALLYVDGVAIGPHDELEVRGVRYAVEGEPGGWVNPFTGWSPGTEVRLRKVTDG